MVIYSIGIEDVAGDGDIVQIGDPAGVRGVRLLINDLNAATGFTTSDISTLLLFRSSDAVLSSNDILLASATLAPLGAATELDATGAGGNRNLGDGGPPIFLIVQAVIYETAVTGHAFTVGALVDHVGFKEVPNPPTAVGTAIVASDANHVAIGRPPQPVIGGTLAIPFGGESAMLCLLLGTGAFVLWRRA